MIQPPCVAHPYTDALSRMRFGLTRFFVAVSVVYLSNVAAFGQFVGYVPNTTSNTVTIFATQLTTQAAPLDSSNTDNTIQTLPSTTGWKAPVRVAVLGDGQTGSASTAYITSQGDNGLWAINTLTQLATRSATATNINTGSNPLKLSQPGGIAISTAPVVGSTNVVIAAYVANQNDGTISIVNIDSNSSSPNTLIANIPTTNAASSIIPEVFAAGGFVFVTQKTKLPSLWSIDITNPTQATQIALPEGTLTLSGLNAFQLTDNFGGSHTFVATASNAEVIVIDLNDPNSLADNPPVFLSEEATPVSLVSAFDVQADSPSIQAIYVADSASGFPIWYLNVDCSLVDVAGAPCTIPSPDINRTAQQITNAQASPTSIGVTPDGQQLFFPESSSPGIQNFCIPGSTCSELVDNASDTTVGSGPTGILVTDISAGSPPLCWLTANGAPPATATAMPPSVCSNLNNCNPNGTALGACAQSRNLAATNITLDFEDTFGCVPFGTLGSPTPTCSAQGGLGGQTLYNVAGVFTTVISQTNTAGTGQVQGQTQVSADVTITTQPASQSVNQGTPITLTVAATSANSAAISYQWYVGTSGTGTPIGGATSASYQTTPSTTTSYWVQVNDGTGPVNSSTAVITVNAPPTITIQPVSQSILQGTSAALSVTATGGGTLSYQWYSGTSGDTSSPIANATGSSYTTPLQNTTGTYTYWVRVSNSLGHADSNTATITVTTTQTPPSITTQPANQTIVTGQTAILTVVASGTSLSYQWYQGASGITSGPIKGATGSSYITPALTSTNSYWVRVTNSVGQVDSATATITVTSPLSATPPASTTISAGQSLKFTITLNSGGSNLTLSCQSTLPAGTQCWFSPLQISSGQSSTLTVATAGPISSIRYRDASGLFYALISPVSFLAFFFTIRPPRKSANRGRLLQFLLPGLLLFGLIGCGTNPNSVPANPKNVTPPGVYTFVVAATDSNNVVQATTSINFTVQ